MIQYLIWMKEFFSGNFGYSWSFRLPVYDVILKHLPVTLMIMIPSIIISWSVGCFFGIYTAVRRNAVSSRIISAFFYVGYSIPEFFLACSWIVLACETRQFPIYGVHSNVIPQLGSWELFLDLLWHLVGPIVVLSSVRIATVFRLMKGQMIEQLGTDYVQFARAKGMPENNILYKHALKNAFNPLLTNFAFVIADIVSGSLIVEYIFGIKGVGNLLRVNIEGLDVYLLMALLLLFSLILIVCNLLVDIILAWNDPRIRYRFVG